MVFGMLYFNSHYMAAKKGGAMEFFKEIFRIWKRNLIPAIIGVIPLLVFVILKLVFPLHPLFLMLGLGIAAWTFGIFFRREPTERRSAAWYAALLLMAILSIAVSIGESSASPSIRGGIVLATIVIVFVFSLYFWLAGCAGRMIGRKTGLSLLAGLLVVLFAAPAMSGVSATVALMLPTSEWWLYEPMFVPYSSGFLVAILLLGCWLAILARRGERNTPLLALRDFIIGTIGSYVIFAIACAVTIVRAYGTLELVKESGRQTVFLQPGGEAGRAAMERLFKASDDWRNQCQRRKPPIELPMASIYLWNASDSKVTEEMRRAAAVEIETPEAKEFLAAAAALEQYQYFFPENYLLETELPILKSLRLVARQIGGIAAVYHWKGEKERILPLLRLQQNGPNRTLDSAPKLMLYKFYRIALDSMLAENLVQLGPDGPQYAEEYRRYLDYFLNTDYTIPDEVECQAAYLQTALTWPKQLNYILRDQPVPFLKRIFAISVTSGRLRKYLDIQPRIAELRTAGKIGDVESADRFTKQFMNNLQIEMRTRSWLSAMLALKLYRSLNGTYPETLEQLVPELLPAVPIDPETGAPFIYTRTPEGFELVFLEKVSRFHTGSKPTY